MSDATAHDPGGRVRLPLQAGVCGDAWFSPCRKYRYWLSRWWGEPVRSCISDNYALWIGMNPSTAEADIDDPTIRKEMHFTRQMGLCNYMKCNVMDLRLTNPKKLIEWGAVPCSNENFAAIQKMARDAHVVIAAWGRLPKPLRNLATSVAMMLSSRDLMCMGTTKDGSPRHPLYLRNDAAPILWRPAT